MIKHNRDLFRILCGLELEIRRSDGSPINPTSYQSRLKQSYELKNPFECSCTNQTPNCTHINPEALERLLETHEPQSYLCQGNLKKIIIPIVLNNEVIGIIFTGENASFQFKGDQYHMIMRLLLQFTNYIVQNELTPLNVSIYEGNTTSRQKELLNRAVKYIRNNFHSNNLTLKEVSIQNGISYHHLSRIFKKELNTTFAQFRNKVRMEAAAKLLKSSRLSVSQVSFTCGFDDPAYFCKVFKEAYQMSPVAFRLQKSSSTVSKRRKYLI